MFKPQWEGVIEGYSKNYIQKNLWKYVHLDFEREDLLHEAVIVFCDCRDKYKDTVDTPQHFMALFMTALHNRFWEIAQESCSTKENVVDEDVLDVRGINIHIGEEGSLRILIKQAPQEIKEVLVLAFNAPAELLDAIGFNEKGSRNFFNNVKLCNMLGKDPKRIDLVQQMRDYFGTEF